MGLTRGRSFSDRFRPVAVLDVGSSKTTCLIAEPDPYGAPQRPHRARRSEPRLIVRGFACHRSRGIKSGVVADLDEAQRVIRAVVAEAEQMARAHVASVHVAVNCGRPRSKTFVGHVEVTEGVVRKGDLITLSSGAESFALRDGGTLIALQQTGFRLDGQAVAGTPLGLACRHLAADNHAVVVDEGPLHNLSLLVRTCHIDVAGMIPAAYASGIAATTEEERRLGVTVIDIGAGTTAVAAFIDGHYLYTDLVPVGGQHLTLDIAHGLGMPLAEAERIKALYGTLVWSASAEHEPVTYHTTGVGDSGRGLTTRAELGRIVRSRMEGLVEPIRDRLLANPVGRLAASRIVLCGGTSRLLSSIDFFASMFAGDGQSNRSRGSLVRVASPGLLQELVEEQSGPAFACLAGMQLVAHGEYGLQTGVTWGEDIELGYLGRVERWLRESF